MLQPFNQRLKVSNLSFDGTLFLTVISAADLDTETTGTDNTSSLEHQKNLATLWFFLALADCFSVILIGKCMLFLHM